MNSIIYIDILFLINLIIDYLIISSTGIILGYKIITWRVLCASIVGATYSVIVFFPQLKLFNIIIFKVLISIIIVIISYKYSSFLSVLKSLLVYYIINMVYGGGMYAFHHFTSAGTKMNFSNGVYYIDLPLWLIITLTFIFYFVIKLFTRISDTRANIKTIEEVTIDLGEVNVNVKALIDTGNTLYDPISLLPVMIVQSNVFYGKLSNSFLNECSNGNASSLPFLHKVYPDLKIRFIPFKDITGNKKVIFAIKPRKIVLKSSNKELPTNLIGITSTTLSDDGTYNALLHSSTKK